MGMTDFDLQGTVYSDSVYVNVLFIQLLYWKLTQNKYLLRCWKQLSLRQLASSSLQLALRTQIEYWYYLPKSLVSSLKEFVN